ncbi:hypothetical protein TWF569_005318 [Orbilia oligospora]|nr:hypothetical protein TWF706_003246 [Orbilia oligospora]KAF3135364.1 hypothetical protein TWF594_008427 [Orbilia oligospora]KAF3148823.1 hypothetical protein TWF569_005318 [Orbilia oligospora]
MSSHPHPPPTAPRPHGHRGGHGGRGRGQGRGRGRGSSGGGGTSHPRPGQSAFAATNGLNPVPRHSAIHTNTHVSIVLKEDQPTGRQVTGLVADVLTRGDHHRGIKVRLKDGRVGRVQRVLHGVPESSSTVQSGSAGGGQLDGAAMEESSSGFQNVNLGDRRGGGGHRSNYRGGGRGRGRGGFRPYNVSSARGEDGNERSEATYDLTAFIRGGRRGGRYRNQRGGRGFGDTDAGGSGGRWEELELSSLGSEEFLENSPSNDPIIRCPVCSDFEGDETAVSHHVEAHFR